ncbi:DUF1911 domain-containing protein [Acinetobacter sp. Tr-809]|uniref:DUF1911 domain-containing protein n=1 Tax=Acinetobacter sp. Tr-809 TaxID=2608324 RepID=UPI0014220DBB|nr:DUF1911 domain-containing protein [Acinetobacter sp. Tr-809]NIE96820.1 DUF1911 domain-containing protein [Acinetobacter sp. Tr-809]
MNNIDQAQEFEKLQQQLDEVQASISDRTKWRISQSGSLDHWNDIKAQVSEYKENESLYFDPYALDDLDVYQLLEQEIYLKNFCLELTYLIRLAYDLGLPSTQIREIYLSVYQFWLAYSDLRSLIQSHGQQLGVAAIELTTDYSHALLLLCCAMCYGDEADIIKILDGLLAYPSDRLIDLISYPYLDVETISENYAVDYPFKQLDSLLNTTVDVSTMNLYLQQIEHDQQQGKYWTKKFFHKIALLGKWRFEALMICKLYAIELGEIKNLASFPNEFEI